MESDGDVVITGQTSVGSFFAERLTSAGAADPSFGDDGVFAEQLGTGTDPSSRGTDVTVSPSGDLVFAVSASTGPDSPGGFLLEELTPAGAPDGNFVPTAFTGVPGVVALANPTQVVLQPGRGYVVTGVGTGPTYQRVPVVARFNLNGTLDTSFGRDGVYVGAPVGSVAGIVTRSDGLLDLVWNGELPGDNAVI